MTTYRVEYTVETWYTASVEADSHAEALEFFMAGDYGDEEYIGSELQDSVEVTEV